MRAGNSQLEIRQGVAIERSVLGRLNLAHTLSIKARTSISSVLLMLLFGGG
jgi:hypothetical protein